MKMGGDRNRKDEARENRGREYCLQIIFEIFFIANLEIKPDIIKFLSFGFFLKVMFFSSFLTSSTSHFNGYLMFRPNASKFFSICSKNAIFLHLLDILI